ARIESIEPARIEGRGNVQNGRVKVIDKCAHASAKVIWALGIVAVAKAGSVQAIVTVPNVTVPLVRTAMVKLGGAKEGFDRARHAGIILISAKIVVVIERGHDDHLYFAAGIAALLVNAVP